MFYNIEQNSPAWFQKRLGLFTSSSIASLFKAKTTLEYQKLIAKVAYERMFNEQPDDIFQGNAYTDRGHELEPDALELFQLETMKEVRPGGFWQVGNQGSSPDGLCDEATIEVKCLAFNNFIRHAITDEVPKDYIHQCQHQLLVTEKEKGYFLLYHPKFRLKIIDFQRDEKIIKGITEKVDEAETEVINIINKLSYGK